MGRDRLKCLPKPKMPSPPRRRKGCQIKIFIQRVLTRGSRPDWPRPNQERPPLMYFAIFVRNKITLRKRFCKEEGGEFLRITVSAPDARGRCKAMIEFQINKTKKTLAGMRVFRLLSSEYEVRFIAGDEKRGIYDVRNLKNGHCYRVRVRPILRLSAFSLTGEMVDQPRGTCPCPRSLEGACQHLLLASFENAKRLNIEVEFSFFSTFTPSRQHRRELEAA